MNKHRILLLLLLALAGSVRGQNIISADTIAAKGGLRINVGALKHTFETATKVVNAASTHLQIPTAKAVWDALTANLVNLSGGTGVTITGTPPNLTISVNDASSANEGVLGVGAGGASSSTITTNTSGGNPVTINVAGPLTIAETTSVNGGSITITCTAASALSGVVNQVPYFNTTSTITTEPGSGANSLTWDPTNNRFGVGVASPAFALDVLGAVNGTHSGVYPASFSTSGSTGRVSINAGSNSGFSFLNGGAEKWIAASYLPSGSNYSFTFYNNQTASDGLFINGDNNNVGMGNNSPQRKLHVTGEARITDLTTDTPTRIVGADADGDLGAITVGSGLTLSGSTLSTSGGTAWLLDGNTLSAAAAIGSNSNHSVSIETNGINRVWVANTGQVTIGAAALTTYALNINGLQGGGGLFVDGGTGLVGPTFASFRGSGSGSTAYVADYQLNILSGNVLAYIANTATTGTGSAVMSLNVNSGVSGDPVYYAGVSGGGGWYFGADNSATGDPFRITNGSNLGAVATGVTILSDGKFGVGTLTPGTTGDFFGSDAISIPSGPSGNRPTNARPHLRYNSTFGGFEAYDPNKSAWFRLSALSTPSVSPGAAAGTGASAVFASGSGIAASNDCSGTIDLTTGTSTAAGTLLTLTFFEPYNGTSTWVSLDAGNDIATEQRNFYSSQAASNTQFTIRARTPLNPSVTYRIKYNVRSY